MTTEQTAADTFNKFGQPDYMFCCHIEQGSEAGSNWHPAEYEIHGNNDHWSENTQSCSQHLGEMLTHPERGEPNEVWTVWQISQPKV